MHLVYTNISLRSVSPRSLLSCKCSYASGLYTYDDGTAAAVCVPIYSASL